MSNAILNTAWSAPCGSKAEKLVLLRLADMANAQGVCWPSVAKLALDCALSPRSVPRAIVANEKHGHVTVNRVPGRNSQYTVHPRQTVTPTPDAVSPPPPTPCLITPDTVAPKPSGTFKGTSEKALPSANGTRAPMTRFAPTLMAGFKKKYAKEVNGDR